MRNSKACVYFATFVAFLLLAQYSNAAKTDSLQIETFVLLNQNNLLVYHDLKSGQLEKDFKAESFLAKLPGKDTLWLKVKTQNNSSYKEWILTLDPSILYATVYVGDNISKSTGTYVPMSERDIKTGQNNIQLTLPIHRPDSFYIKMISKVGFNSVPQYQLTPFNTWQKNHLLSKADFNLELGMFLGVSIFICIALVFFYIRTKDRSYLYYAFYLLFASLYTMGSFGYIWFVIGEIPRTFWVIESLILIGCYISFFKFIQHYFSLKSQYPFWNNIFNGIYGFLVLMLLSRLFLPEVDSIRSIILTSVLLVTIVFFIYLIVKKNPLVMYVFGGTMAFVVSFLLAIVFHNFNINFFLDFNDLAMIGIATQILLFSLGLANRMQLVLKKSQEAQGAFILQLEENQKNQQEINDQLEKKVKLRTKEISKQKEEIQEKAKELEKVNEEVRLMNENLEREVFRRTEHIKLQNKKLIDYAFRNAHHIRGPLARILGLMYLIKKDRNNSELQKFYIERLEVSAKELDTSIKKSSKLLEEEDTFSVGRNQI